MAKIVLEERSYGYTCAQRTYLGLNLCLKSRFVGEVMKVSKISYQIALKYC